jgi:WD40 repeat protein
MNPLKHFLVVFAALSLSTGIGLIAEFQRMRPVVFKGATGIVQDIVLSPNGKLLAAASSDNTIMLWDVATHRGQTTLRGLVGKVFALAFSPDSKMLAAAGGNDHTIMLWETATGKRLAGLRGHTDTIHCVAFSPDGKTLASASSDKTSTLWDLVSCKPRMTLRGHTSAASSLSFSPDGQTLASGSWDETIRLWEIASGKQTMELHHQGYVYHVIFSPDGKHLASGDMGAVVKLWDSATGEELPLEEPPSFDEGVDCVAFSLDSKRLCAACNNQIAFWEVKNGRNIANYDYISGALTEMIDDALRRRGWALDYGRVVVRTVSFTPDGRPIAMVTDDPIVEMRPLPDF